MDKVLIKMPETLYEFLYTLSVVQDYQLQLAVGANETIKRQDPSYPGSYLFTPRDPLYQVTIRMKEEFKVFAPCLQVVKDNVPVIDYTGWDEEQRGEYDCFLRFDEDLFTRAKNLASIHRFSFIDGMNKLFGTGAISTPVLAALQLKTECKIDVLILPWSSIEEANIFYGYLAKNYPQLEVILDDRDLSTYSIEDVLAYLVNFKIVIGPASPIVYLASALKKIVIETFTNTEDMILYNTDRENYRGIIGRNIPASMVWTVWEDLCSKLSENLLSTKFQQESIQQEEQESIVDSVEEKSCAQSSPRLDQLESAKSVS